jgi:hypothetical protein
MATVVKTARTTQSGIASSRHKVQMGDLYKLEDNSGAMWVTANMMGKKKAGGYEVKWHTLELRPKFDTLGAAITAVGDTTVTVSNGTYFQINDLIKVTSTKESMMVTGVTGNNLGVTRSWGAVAAQTASNGAEVLIVASHYGENARLQAGRTVTEVQYSNQVALWRDNFEISGTLQAIGEQGGLYHGNDVDLQRDQMHAAHKRGINHACLFSEIGRSGDQRSMMGIIEFIKTYGSGRTNSTSAVTFSVFQTASKTAVRYLKNKRMVIICSTQFAQIVTEWALGLSASNPNAVINMDPEKKLFGLRVIDIRTAHGDFRLLVDDALEGTEYSKYAICVGTDKGNAPEWRYLRDTRVIKNRQDTDQDGYEEEILTEGTMEDGNPDHLYLFDSAATSA